MTIIAFEHSPTTARGGSERSYFDVLTGLRSKGHRVVLFYLEDGNLVPRYHELGVETRMIRNFSYLLRPGAKVQDFMNMLRARKQFRSLKSRESIVYLNFTEAIPFAALLRMSYGFPLVCHIRLGYYGLSRQIRWAGRSVDAFILISRKLLAEFKGVFAEHAEFSVVYNGLTIPPVLPPVARWTANSPMKILYLGRIAPEKGVSELVSVLGRIINAGVQVTLNITGDFIMSHSGDYRRELQDAIRAAGVEACVTLHPPVENPLDYIGKFDLFVVPATWEEPFGRTVPESILAGVPVLARNVGMMEEIMIDNPQFLFSTDQQLADKIMSFHRGEMSFDFARARARIASDFNKDRMVDEVEKVLLKIAAR